MATTNLLPRNIAGAETLAYNNWTKTSGAAYVNIDDPVGSPDDATTVITVNTITSPASKQSFYVDDWSLGGATITAVNAKVRMKSQFSNGAFRLSVRNSAGTEDAGPAAITNLTTSFANYTIDITGNRPGSGSWVTADLASLQLIVFKPSGGSNLITVTQVYLEITYTVASTSLTAGQESFGMGFSIQLGLQAGYAAAWASQLGLQAGYARAFATIQSTPQPAFARAFATIPGNQAAYAASWASQLGLQAAFARGFVALVSTPQPAYATGVGNIQGSQAAWAQGPLTSSFVSTPQAAYATGIGTIPGLQAAYAASFAPIQSTAQQAYANAFGAQLGSQGAYAFVSAPIAGQRDAYATGKASLPAFQNAYATGSNVGIQFIANFQNAYATGVSFLGGLQALYASGFSTQVGAQAAYAMPLAFVPGAQPSYAAGKTSLRGNQAAWARGPYQIFGAQAAWARGIGTARILYTVVAIEGPSEGSWAKLFDRLAKSGESFVIRENIGDNQILVTLEPFAETHVRSESVTETVYACPIPGTLLFPQVSGLYPC